MGTRDLWWSHGETKLETGMAGVRVVTEAQRAESKAQVIFSPKHLSNSGAA